MRGARRVLLALCVDLGRRVEVGLLARAGSAHVELLLVHRGIGGEEGAVDRGTLGAVGGCRVAVFDRRGIVVGVGAGEVGGVQLDGSLVVDSFQDNAALLRVHLGDPQRWRL